MSDASPAACSSSATEPAGSPRRGIDAGSDSDGRLICSPLPRLGCNGQPTAVLVSPRYPGHRPLPCCRGLIRRLSGELTPMVPSTSRAEPPESGTSAVPLMVPRARLPGSVLINCASRPRPVCTGLPTAAEPLPRSRVCSRSPATGWWRHLRDSGLVAAGA